MKLSTKFIIALVAISLIVDIVSISMGQPKPPTWWNLFFADLSALAGWSYVGLLEKYDTTNN